MHWEVNYATNANADSAAVQDISDWLGSERFAQAEIKLKAAQCTEEEFEMVCSFLGIRGYPVGAWYRRLWPQN